MPGKSIAFIKSAAIEDFEVDRDMVNLKLAFSSEIRDKQGDLFLKSAWTHPEDVDYFLKKGVIDWNHLSRSTRFLKSGSDPVARAEAERKASEAVLGVPKKGIYIENDRPVCEARINAKNPYIAPYIPLLKEGYTGLEASAAGGAYEPSGETISKYGENAWDRAVIDHIAICPATQAINPMTQIEMIKSAIAEELGFEKKTLPPKPEPQPASPVLDQAIINFMKSQPMFKQWVGEKLIEGLVDTKTIQPRFDAVYGFLKSHGLDEQESHDHAIEILHLIK